MHAGLPGEHAVPLDHQVNGEDAHSFNANRISLLIPKPGEVEHWTYVNGGGGWDHPIHLHFEEGVTMYRGADVGLQRPRSDPRNGKARPQGRLAAARRQATGPSRSRCSSANIGGSYVNHCHNTVHEDFAMLMRIQLLTGVAGSPQNAVTPTPNPSPDGVTFTTPEILPEGDPRS